MGSGPTRLFRKILNSANAFIPKYIQALEIIAGRVRSQTVFVNSWHERAIDLVMDVLSTLRRGIQSEGGGYDICDDQALSGLQTAINQKDAYRYGTVRLRKARVARIVGRAPTLKLFLTVASALGVQLSSCTKRPLSMTFSPLHHWKEPTTRCSICGWSVTLELSKTDEQGQAVHECCYVGRTLSKFRKPIDELPQSRAITPFDLVSTASTPAPPGMYWRIFELVRW